METCIAQNRVGRLSGGHDQRKGRRRSHFQVSLRRMQELRLHHQGKQSFIQSMWIHPQCTRFQTVELWRYETECLGWDSTSSGRKAHYWCHQTIPLCTRFYYQADKSYMDLSLISGSLRDTFIAYPYRFTPAVLDAEDMDNVNMLLDLYFCLFVSCAWPLSLKKLVNQ